MAKYNSFSEFYPFYLSQHQNRTSRRLHIIGTSLSIALAIAFVMTWEAYLLIALPICGYGFAWIGHFFIEKNKPATFTYPLWSLAGDFTMLKDVLTGRMKF